MKPIPSVMCPVSPPFSFTIVFTAPQSSAAGESLSKYCPTTVSYTHLDVYKRQPYLCVVFILDFDI